MTNQQKKRWLQEYRSLTREIERINRRIDNCIEEIDSLKATATRSTAVLDGVPGDSGHKSREDLWIKLADLSDEVNELIDKYIDERRTLEKKRKKVVEAIGEIDNHILEQLLIARYIDNLKFEEIAIEMEYCIRHIWRLHGAALTKLKIK